MSDKNEMLVVDDLGEIKKDVDVLEKELLNNHHIDQNLYIEYDVKRGLRDSAGKGVLTGLTEISDVCAYDLVNGRTIPAEGSLYYQGVNVVDLVAGLKGRRFGFEETSYLLMFGKLPTKEQLERYIKVSEEFQTLSGRFVRDVVMKASNANIMNVRLGRMAVTVAVDGNSIEHINVDDAVSQIIRHTLICFCHALKEFRMQLIMPARVTCAAGVNTDFSPGGGKPDRGILDRAAITCHGMSLKMGKYHIGVVVIKSSTDEISRQPIAAIDRDLHIAVLIQDLEIRDLCETVILSHLIVLCCCGAHTAIGRVALNNGGVQ